MATPASEVMPAPAAGEAAPAAKAPVAGLRDPAPLTFPAHGRNRLVGRLPRPPAPAGRGTPSPTYPSTCAASYPRSSRPRPGGRALGRCP
jgi:hypothetical protein